mmetsp:Transcript_1751/g.4841  ORF Transcript_1751/g.4841 Transcript_1751/m.4841 type:complete len:145 (-) Transcript_1751:1181-1615(-)
MRSVSSSAAVLLCSSLLVSQSAAFQVSNPAVSRATAAAPPSSTTELHIFGNALKDAFGNEDMGKKQNAGLSNGPNINEAVQVNGKPVKGAVVGQKITAVANKVRVKIPVNCQQGDCGTCVVRVNGRKVKACQTVLGSVKTSIQT